MQPLSLTRTLLRFAVAVPLLYAGIAGIITPDLWLGYFPSFVTALVDQHLVLTVWSVVEIGIGIWILSGWRIRWPAAFSALMFFLIVAFNSSQMIDLFRDIGLGFAALALAVCSSD